MRNALKQMGRLGAAVLALVMAAGVCQASVYINLSLAVDTGAKEWSVYATLDDTSSETLGLHAIAVDVWGSPTQYGPWTGDLMVNNGTAPLGELMLPSGRSPGFTTVPKDAFDIGFGYITAPGTVSGTGILLMGAMQMSLHQQREKSGVTYNSILKGVGESAGSAPVRYYDEDENLITLIEWEHPVLVAEGTYTGDEGWLNVSVRVDEDPKSPYFGMATSVTVLPASLPTPTAEGVQFAAANPMPGVNYHASFYIIPEPATLALLGLGGLGLILGRKRR